MSRRLPVRLALRIVGLWLSALIVVLVVFIVIKSNFDFKVFGARIVVDGRPSGSSRLYLNRFRQSGVLVRRDSAKQELYGFSLRRVDDRGPSVFPCEDSGYILLPGIALSEHHSWAQACFFSNLTLRDGQGNILSEPKRAIQGTPTIKSRLIEFIAVDGKAVKVEW